VRKRKHNPKREIRDLVDQPFLKSLRGKVKYVGSPFHKRSPGDFGLTPSSQPRPDKTLCDKVKIFKVAIAQRLLLEGVAKGLISTQLRGDLPQNICVVTSEGVPLEAQLDNADAGTYHGYPMADGDPLAKKVLERWNAESK
jgi:hypothetical protein